MPTGSDPAAALLRVVGLFMKTGYGLARRVTRIAQQKLMGEDLSQLAPPGFDATAAHYLLVEAVAWTAALRVRLRALVGRPAAPLVPALPTAARAPQGRGAAQVVTVMYEVDPADPHDWPVLAKPWRIGPSGVAVTLRLTADKSHHEVVDHVCDNVQQVIAQLGAEADLPRLAALEATARALCAEVDAASAAKAADPGEAKTADPGWKKAKDAPRARAASWGGPEDDTGPAAEDDPPPEHRPDG